VTESKRLLSALVKNLGVGLVRWVLVVVIVVGCEEEAGVTKGDADRDAGACPDYVPNDAGIVQLTRRGCPLTIDYAIR
jgi:hypothetical protein